jgi:uncharacterized protein YjiS (DUF1127 family)
MFTHIRNRIGDWRRYRQTLNELRHYSDDELAELGLHRCDLRRLARESIRR